jgi:hypothetical protein
MLGHSVDTRNREERGSRGGRPRLPASDSPRPTGMGVIPSNRGLPLWIPGANPRFEGLTPAPMVTTAAPHPNRQHSVIARSVSTS